MFSSAAICVYVRGVCECVVYAFVSWNKYCGDHVFLSCSLPF